MNHPRIIRWLRVSFTAVCLLVCVLLVALWVRSYTMVHTLYVYRNVHHAYIHSVQGKLILQDFALQNPLSHGHWLSYKPGQASEFIEDSVEGLAGKNFCFKRRGQFWDVSVPHWFPASIALSLATLPWLPWRFSLRTLLIAVMLLSIALGMSVFLSG